MTLTPDEIVTKAEQCLIEMRVPLLSMKAFSLRWKDFLEEYGDDLPLDIQAKFDALGAEFEEFC